MRYHAATWDTETESWRTVCGRDVFYPDGIFLRSLVGVEVDCQHCQRRPDAVEATDHTAHGLSS